MLLAFWLKTSAGRSAPANPACHHPLTASCSRVPPDSITLGMAGPEFGCPDCRKSNTRPHKLAKKKKKKGWGKKTKLSSSSLLLLFVEFMVISSAIPATWNLGGQMSANVTPAEQRASLHGRAKCHPQLLKAARDLISDRRRAEGCRRLPCFCQGCLSLQQGPAAPKGLGKNPSAASTPYVNF